MARPASQHNLGLRSLILVGLLVFGFFLVTERGLLGDALRSDRSYISYVILAIYVVASCQWGMLTFRMSAERNRLVVLETEVASAGATALGLTPAGVEVGEEDWEGGYLADHLRNLLDKHEAGVLAGEQSALIRALGDTIANRHSTGHFASDVLLKLGLLGTMVGFILMLAPVAQVGEFEGSAARQLLADMSGGMAVALYTTVAGLVTSTLLKLQYQVLDSAAQDLLNRVTVVTDAYVSAVGGRTGAP